MKLVKTDTGNETGYSESSAEDAAQTTTGNLKHVLMRLSQEVRAHGDEALFACTEKFDGAKITADTIRVTKEEIEEAYEVVDPSLL